MSRCALALILSFCANLSDYGYRSVAVDVQYLMQRVFR